MKPKTKMVKLLHINQDADVVLVEKLRHGDRKAQAKTFEKYSAQMLGVSRRYVQQLEDAEEVLCNSFIKVFGQITQFKKEGDLGAWIRRIVVNESLNYIRYKKNLFVELTEDHPEFSTPNVVLQKYTAEDLLNMINELPLGYRTVFNLFAIEGYSHSEIAEMLSISEATSKSQLRKARIRLQEKLEDHQRVNSI